MKKIAMITLVLACILVGCGVTGQPSASIGSSSSLVEDNSSSEPVGMPTPFTIYSNLEEAHEAMEMDFKTPGELPEGFVQDSISVWNDKSIAQIIYANGDEQITYRVSATVEASALTGDYTQYAAQKELTVNDMQVSCQGNDEESISVATWQQEDVTYSITSTVALTVAQLETIIKSI